MPAKNLVFLDESSAKTNMTRLYGRAEGGQRVLDHTPHGHWKSTTMLSAIRLGGVMREATAVFDGAMNKPTFEAWVEYELVPSLKPGDVVVMDNLSSHKGKAVRQLIESVDARLVYLPPYSPDLNPIEQMWSKAKSYLRKVSARSLLALEYAIGEALDTVTAQDIYGWFQKCKPLV